MADGGNKKVSGPSGKRYYERRKVGLAKANKDKRIKAQQAFMVRKQMEKRSSPLLKPQVFRGLARSIKREMLHTPEAHVDRLMTKWNTTA